MIPADKQGGFIYIKDFRIDEEKRMFVQYRSTYNDIPFMETQIHIVDEGQNAVICGDDGTVIWRFSVGWIQNIM